MTWDGLSATEYTLPLQLLDLYQQHYFYTYIHIYPSPHMLLYYSCLQRLPHLGVCAIILIAVLMKLKLWFSLDYKIYPYLACYICIYQPWLPNSLKINWMNCIQWIGTCGNTDSNIKHPLSKSVGLNYLCPLQFTQEVQWNQRTIYSTKMLFLTILST